MAQRVGARQETLHHDLGHHYGAPCGHEVAIRDVRYADIYVCRIVDSTVLPA